MLDPSTVSELRRLPLKFLWGMAAAATGFLVFTDTVPEAIRIMLGGWPDLEGWMRLYVVGSLTLPLTIGIAVIAFMLMNVPPMDPPAANLVLFSAILVGAGLVSTLFVSFAIPVTFEYQPGPLYVSLPLMAIRAYLSAYGLLVFVSAIIIGSALGLTMDRMSSLTQ